MATTSSMDLVALVREYLEEAHPDVLRSLIETMLFATPRVNRCVAILCCQIVLPYGRSDLAPGLRTITTSRDPRSGVLKSSAQSTQSLIPLAPLEGRSGPAVQLGFGLVEIGSGIDPQVPTFGEELAH